MTATLVQANTDIHTTFRTAWLADPSSVNIPVLYSDVPSDPPDVGAWARVSVKSTDRSQVTLVGDTGSRRFRGLGLVTVEIYTPRGDGKTLALTLAKVAVDAFEGVSTTNGVIFRRVRPVDVGPDANKYHYNVLAEFEYDEVR